jgi:hypothetical protein
VKAAQDNYVKRLKKTDSQRFNGRLVATRSPGGELVIVEHPLTKIQKRDAALIHEMLVALKKVLPRTDHQLIGDLVADLSSLFTAAQQFNKTLDALSKLQSPRGLEQLEDLLGDLRVHQCSESVWWIDGLKKTVPKLENEVEKERRRQRRLARTKRPSSRREIKPV